MKAVDHVPLPLYTDIDECTLENAPCSKDRCNNTIGSFTCSPCQDGYTEGSEGKCVGEWPGTEW